MEGSASIGERKDASAAASWVRRLRTCDWRVVWSEGGDERDSKPLGGRKGPRIGLTCAGGAVLETELLASSRTSE